MQPAVLVAIFVALFVAIVLPILLSGAYAKEAQDKAREHRMAGHRMNARLLRFNL